MNEANLTVTRKVNFSMRNKGRREIKPGPQPVPDRVPAGSVPRVSRLMALAIRFDDLIRSGTITDQADLARLGHVSRARITQVMNLLHLAPTIQEEVLYLPRVTAGRDPISERHLRTIVAEVDWARQVELWSQIKHAAQKNGPGGLTPSPVV